ncbi:hypothetical protein PG984_001029 [Apiospora sp. TS-2023a]
MAEKASSPSRLPGVADGFRPLHPGQFPLGFLFKEQTINWERDPPPDVWQRGPKRGPGEEPKWPSSSSFKPIEATLCNISGDARRARTNFSSREQASWQETPHRVFGDSEHQGAGARSWTSLLMGGSRPHSR